MIVATRFCRAQVIFGRFLRNISQLKQPIEAYLTGSQPETSAQGANVAVLSFQKLSRLLGSLVLQLYLLLYGLGGRAHEKGELCIPSWLRSGVLSVRP